MAHKVLREFSVKIEAKPETVWKYVAQLGIKNGWYIWGHFFKKSYTPVVAREKLAAGINVDFFKVETVEEGRYLKLKTGRSYMDVVLEIKLEPAGLDGTVMTLTTTMQIKNFIGSLYWLFIQVPDEFLQAMMMANIKKYAKASA